MSDSPTRWLTNDTTVRRCRSCGELREISQFRRRGRNSDRRFRQCRECHNGAMRRHRQAKKTRDRKARLTDHIQRLQDARTESARLRIVDEIGGAFGRHGTVGQTFHQLLAESQRRGNHRQTLKLLNAFVQIATTAAKCSNSVLDTLDGTLREIEQAAEDA